MTVDYSTFGDKAEPEASRAVIDSCLKMPLYRVLGQGDKAKELARWFEDTSLTVDVYCVGCKKEATFRRQVAKKSEIRSPPGHPKPTRIISFSQTVTVTCTRNPVHTYTFMFGPYGGGIAKVGQNPSAYDIATADLARFAGVLDALDLRELEQAVLLHSHGAGVGAFVYLRRIFERLLSRHEREYMRENGPIEGFESMSVEDQVLALKNVLPEEVVQNRKVYRVLSKGIHQLDEDECLAHYDVMHAAIVEILERDIYDQQRAKTSADLRKAVADVVGKVGATKRPAAERPQ